jgi:hypothetical protein
VAAQPRAGSFAPERALLAFAVSVFVFHHLPTLVGGGVGDAIDLLTPFVVIGTAAAVLLALGTNRGLVALALAGGVLYVDGHGIHLGANAVAREDLAGSARDVAHFWDEQLGHIEWHLGWLGLLVVFCLAERAGGATRARPGATEVMAALLLGFTFFTNAVEGGTWWLALAGAALLVPWGVLARRPVVSACAGGLGLTAVLLGVWAVWHLGMPQFSDLGWI